MFRISCLALSLCVTSLAYAQAPASVERKDPLEARASARSHEYSLKSQTGPSRGTSVVPRATATYSADTTAAPEFVRPFADCTGASAIGPVRYHVQEFSVDTDGAYDITSEQEFDGYLFLYEESFDPAAANTNCIIGDDDGAAIGSSEILGAALTSGQTYLVVTTGFEAGEEGAFTNTIDGPGEISLEAGISADLSIVKTAPGGINADGPFTYTFSAANAGPEPATDVVVTDVLPASVTFVSSTCGATVAAGTVTWTIGAMAVSDVATCSITVDPVGDTCVTISNTATIDGAEGDAVGSNNSSTVSNGGGNVVLDPSFETSLDDNIWAQTSVNFGTPICDELGCGLGGGTGPRTGDFWVWLGGSDQVEAGSVQQSVTIPDGATELSFWFESFNCSSTNGAADFARLTIDGIEEWRTDATSAACGQLGYQEVIVDISDYGDGAAHVIRFDSETQGGSTTDLSNFFIDDVLIESTPTCSVAATDVSVTLLATPEPAIVGGALTYTSDLANAGPLDALDVTYSLPLPTGVTFTSIDADPALTCTTPAVDTNGTIECEIALLGAAETLSISVVTAVGSEVVDDISATATVSTSSTDNNASNDTATAVTTLEDSADLSVDISDGVANVSDGEDVVYTLVAANAGPATATDAALTASFSANLTGVTWSCEGTNATCPVEDGTGDIVALVTLPAGASLTYTITATVDFSTTEAPTVATAEIEAANLPDGNPGNNTDTDTNGLFEINIFSDGFED